jgi:hypothetical protein
MIRLRPEQVWIHTCSVRNRIIPLMRRPNTDSTPNKPVTLPRNQVLIHYAVTSPVHTVTIRGNVASVYPPKSYMLSSSREVRESSIVKVYSLYFIHFSRRVRQNDGRHISHANLRKGNRVLFSSTQTYIKINNESLQAVKTVQLRSQFFCSVVVWSRASG